MITEATDPITGRIPAEKFVQWVLWFSPCNNRKNRVSWPTDFQDCWQVVSAM
jgi:hypothetical protein